MDKGNTRIATCIDNGHVEDELTVGKDYEILDDVVIAGLTDHVVSNDKGERGRYFTSRFKFKDNGEN